MHPTSSRSKDSCDSHLSLEYISSKSSISSQEYQLHSNSDQSQTNPASFQSSIDCCDQLYRCIEPDDDATIDGEVVAEDTTNQTNTQNRTETSTSLALTKTDTQATNTQNGSETLTLLELTKIDTQAITYASIKCDAGCQTINKSETVAENGVSVSDPEFTARNFVQDTQRLRSSTEKSSDQHWDTFTLDQEKQFGRKLKDDATWNYDGYQQLPRNEGTSWGMSHGCEESRRLAEPVTTTTSRPFIGRQSHGASETFHHHSGRQNSRRTSCSSGLSASYYGSRSGSSHNSTLRKIHDSRPAPNSSHSTGTFSEAPVCRICYMGDAAELLVSPCYCAGSMGLLHITCLQQWLGQSNSSRCEICHFQFTLQKTTMPVSKFLKDPGSVSDRRNLVCDIVSFLLITPTTIITAWICIMEAGDYYSTEQWERQGLISLSVSLLILYALWLIVALRHNIRLWRDWSMFHQDVTLQGVPSTGPPSRPNSRSLPSNNSMGNKRSSQSLGSRSTVGSIQLQSIKISVQGPFHRYGHRPGSRPKELAVGMSSSLGREPDGNNSRHMQVNPVFNAQTGVLDHVGTDTIGCPRAGDKSDTLRRSSHSPGPFETNRHSRSAGKYEQKSPDHVPDTRHNPKKDSNAAITQPYCKQSTNTGTTNTQPYWKQGTESWLEDPKLNSDARTGPPQGRGGTDVKHNAASITSGSQVVSDDSSRRHAQKARNVEERPRQQSSNYHHKQVGHQPNSDTLDWQTTRGRQYPAGSRSTNVGSHCINAGSHSAHPGSHYTNTGSHSTNASSHFTNSSSHYTTQGSNYPNAGSHYKNDGSHSTHPGSNHTNTGSPSAPDATRSTRSASHPVQMKNNTSYPVSTPNPSYRQPFSDQQIFSRGSSPVNQRREESRTVSGFQI